MRAYTHTHAHTQHPGTYLKEEHYHTKLASCYLDTVLQLLSEDSSKEKQVAARQKLLCFLQSSAHYHAPELLSKVQDSDLHRECALLYGRVGSSGGLDHYSMHAITVCLTGIIGTRSTT